MSGSHIAVTHIGADVMLRTAYCPDIFAHRILVTDKDGNELAECHNAQEFVSHRRMQTSLTIAGPMCFRYTSYIAWFDVLLVLYV